MVVGCFVEGVSFSFTWCFFCVSRSLHIYSMGSSHHKSLVSVSLVFRGKKIQQVGQQHW